MNNEFSKALDEFTDASDWVEENQDTIKRALEIASIVKMHKEGPFISAVCGKEVEQGIYEQITVCPMYGTNIVAQYKLIKTGGRV